VRGGDCGQASEHPAEVNEKQARMVMLAIYYCLGICKGLSLHMYQFVSSAFPWVTAEQSHRRKNACRLPKGTWKCTSDAREIGYINLQFTTF
jgi:hypothetical protein